MNHVIYILRNIKIQDFLQVLIKGQRKFENLKGLFNGLLVLFSRSADRAKVAFHCCEKLPARHARSCNKERPLPNSQKDFLRVNASMY